MALAGSAGAGEGCMRGEERVAMVLGLQQKQNQKAKSDRGWGLAGFTAIVFFKKKSQLWP